MTTIKKITEFGVQNYVITPAALAMNETAARTINEQKWQLILSGDAIANVKSTKHNDWTGVTLELLPDMHTPLQYALNHFSIPTPATAPYTMDKPYKDNGIHPFFLVEQYTLCAALGSIFDQNNSINAGFSVNSWRPVPYLTASATISREGHHIPKIQNIFNGFYIDVATQDIDAWLYRVNYQIHLLGKIVFIKDTFVIS